MFFFEKRTLKCVCWPRKWQNRSACWCFFLLPVYAMRRWLKPLTPRRISHVSCGFIIMLMMGSWDGMASGCTIGWWLFSPSIFLGLSLSLSLYIFCQEHANWKVHTDIHGCCVAVCLFTSHFASICITNGSHHNPNTQSKTNFQWIFFIFFFSCLKLIINLIKFNCYLYHTLMQV